MANYQKILERTELDGLFESYISDCRYSKQLRPQTIKSYEEVFRTFRKIMPEIVTIDDLHPFAMSEFFKRIGQRRRNVGSKTLQVGVKASTIRTYYNKLMVFFRWLEQLGYIEKDSLSGKIPKPPNPTYQDEKALTQEQVSRIISAIALNNPHDTLTYKRDLLIMSLFIYTGIRRRELLSLRIQDIDLEAKNLFINGKTSKSKKNRLIPIHPSLMHQITSYLAMRRKMGSNSDALIVSTRTHRPFTVHGLKHWVERYRRLSGIHFHVHQARHTFACELARQRADTSSIMKVMGHSTIRMTETYLRSITSEDSRDYINRLSF